MIRRVLRFVLSLVILLTIAVIGFRIYFRFIHPIAPRVRSQVMQQLSADHSRLISYTEIPDVLRNAIVDTEDRSFFSNIGIDPKGIIRSIFTDVTSDELVQGGSTITQQLIRNSIIGQQRTLQRKLKEAVYAIALTDSMSKKEILALYLNAVYFGHGAYGIDRAAYIYFGRPLNALNDGELTLIAGLPNAPSAYDPFQHFELARARQRIVLDRMVSVHTITAAREKVILADPIRLRE